MRHGNNVLRCLKLTSTGIQVTLSLQEKKIFFFFSFFSVTKKNFFFFHFLVEQQSSQKKLIKMESLCYISLYHKLKLGALGSCHVCYILLKIWSWRKRKHVLKVIFILHSVIWTFRNMIFRAGEGIICYSLLKKFSKLKGKKY